MSSNIKILHIADLHLGKWTFASTEGKRHIQVFDRIIYTATEHDLLLIAGDLIHNTIIEYEYIDYIHKAFKDVISAGTHIAFTPGKGETLESGAIAPFLYEIGIDYLITSPEQKSTYKKDNSSIDLYGYPYGGLIKPIHETNMGKNDFSIGIVNAEYESGSTASKKKKPTITPQNLKQLNHDFIALGGLHSFKVFKTHNRVIAAYPGSPEPLNQNEEGERYILSINIEGKIIKEIKRISVNSTFYKSLDYDCALATTQEQIKNSIINLASLKTHLNVRITGNRDFPLDINTLKETQDKFHNLNIEDTSYPKLELLIEQYYREDSTRGEFFCILKQELNNKTTTDKELDWNLMRVPASLLAKNRLDLLEEWLCTL